MSKEIFAEIRRLIAEDDLWSALSKLQTVLEGTQLDEAILQSARHQDALRQIRSGTVDEQQAAILKNKIRASALALVRDAEYYRETESRQPLEYRNIVERIKNNRGIGTSELLSSETIDDLDEQECANLSKMERVVQFFQEMNLDYASATVQQRLVFLSLAENGHFFKGTFLCLGKSFQIHSISHSAATSQFIHLRH